MPIQATCPGCQTVLQVADTSRGKQIRCGSCKTVFVAGAIKANGNGSTTKLASSVVKPASSAVKTAAKPKNVPTNGAPSKAAPKVTLDEGDDRPEEKKKKKSILPACLIGCGALFLLCGGGGSIGGYFAWKGLNKLKDEAAAKVDQFGEEIKKAEADQRRMQEEAQKNMDAQRRLQEETRQRLNNPFQPNNADKNRPAEKKPNDVLNPPVQPPNNPNPSPPKSAGELVQPVALSIPLADKPLNVLGVVWTGVDGKQGVALVRADKVLRLEQYDFTNGRKIGSMQIPQDLFTSIRDFTPDGTYFLCNQAGTSYTIRAMPNPKPIVATWLPPPVKSDPKGFANTVVAAYFVNGPRVLTVNGCGQVALWSLPTIAGEKPAQEMSFIPPPSVANYPAGLGYGYTALSPDRTRLAVFNGKDGFFLLNTANLQLEGSVTSPEDGKEIPSAINGMLGVAFSPDSKQLAAVFHQQLIGKASKGRALAPQIVRWDVQGRKLTARFADPSRGSGGAGTRVGWWGNDYFWVAYINRAGTLISWDKQKVVLFASLKTWERVCFGNTDGKCWFYATGPDGNAVLKGVDLPAAALQTAEQPLRMTLDGIKRRETSR